MASNYNKRGAKELQRGVQNICFAQTLLCVLFLISVRSSFITTVLTERKENLMKMDGQHADSEGIVASMQISLG